MDQLPRMIDENADLPRMICLKRGSFWFGNVRIRVLMKIRGSLPTLF